MLAAWEAPTNLCRTILCEPKLIHTSSRLLHHVDWQSQIVFQSEPLSVKHVASSSSTIILPCLTLGILVYGWWWSVVVCVACSVAEMGRWQVYKLAATTWFSLLGLLLLVFVFLVSVLVSFGCYQRVWCCCSSVEVQCFLVLQQLRWLSFPFTPVLLFGDWCMLAWLSQD
jgi:hypothetical protein